MATVSYEQHKERVGARQRERVQSYQDIGEIPPVKHLKRRAQCIKSLERFCFTYFPNQFRLPWSDYHKRASEKIERAVSGGGFFAFAMPRGSGKTTLSRAGVLWSILSGRCKYVVLLSATEKAAEKQLKSIKTLLWRNDLLLEDFPHAIYPIRKLNNESRSAIGQRYKGEKTCIEWQANRVVMPWIQEKRSLSSGAVIEVMGMTAEIRGPVHTMPDGSAIRPEFIIADDPQTRESARSPSQSQTRLETLSGDVAFLAGPDKPISIVCPCTVIYEGDLADQILNREKHPEWQGERTRMVESFPTNVGLWDEYADILRQSLKEDGSNESATKFYASHREAMDAGARVSWAERYKEGELSAIQHAMNLKIRDEAAFFSECQNEPIVTQADLEVATADQIVAKVTGYDRGVVPDECSVVTAFTDVQADHLFWMVCAWSPDFSGYVLDYGAWPEQGRNYFTRRDIKHRLSARYAGDESGIIFGALTDLGHKLAGATYPKHGGGELRLSRWCIDGNWRSREQGVKAYAVQSPYANLISISYGRGVTVAQMPFSEAQRAIRWKTGPGWFWSDGPGPAKGVVFDTNLWKKRIHNGLVLSTGSRGSIQLFKAPPQVHRMLADHLLAEKPIKTEAKGRTVYQFVDIPGRDNEGLDSLVGCALGASISGIMPDRERIRTPKKPSLKLAELQKQRWAREGRH